MNWTIDGLNLLNETTWVSGWADNKPFCRATWVSCEAT
jgi:hypothetical protein